MRGETKVENESDGSRDPATMVIDGQQRRRVLRDFW